MAGLGETFEPAVGMFKGGLGNISWIFWVVLALSVVFAIIFVVSKVKKKKGQWTHLLEVKRVLPGGRVTSTIIHKMRRFPLIQGAEVFELEKPLLGSYLFPELEGYTDVNKYSIVVDNNNRVYINKGEFFRPDKNCIEVSAKHAEMDLGFSELKRKYQSMNKTKRKVDWEDIAKYAFLSIAIIALMIVAIVGVNNWSDAQEQKAQAEKANAEAMTQLANAMETNKAVVNLLNLMLPEIKEIKGTSNIQNILNEEVEK